MPFIFSGKFCAVSGSCLTAAISSPAWVGVAVVGGAVFLGYKLIDTKASKSASRSVKKSS